MQQENEDVIKLRKAGKLATTEGIRTVAEIMKKLIHDPWIQQECTRMAWNFIFHYAVNNNHKPILINRL